MKTHTTQTAKACCSVLARHHWLISGTLVHDNLIEPYSYLKFLKVSDMDDIRNYNAKFLTKQVSSETGRKLKTCVARPALDEQMRDLKIQRSATTTITGVPILDDLPDATLEDIVVSCLPHEQRLHNKLAAEVQLTIRKVSRAVNQGRLTEGEASKRILQRITRQRLAVSHPYLIAPDLSRLLQVHSLPDKISDTQAFNAFVEECSDDHRTMVDAQMLDRTCKLLQSYETQRDANGKNIPFPVKAFHKEHNLLKSAKVRGAENKLEEWMTDDPTRKIIVFCIFMIPIKVIEHICQIKGWGVKLYHGAMTHKARNHSLKQWRQNPQANILISSLGAGGMGLTLTEGSRCLIVDLDWNTAREDQAMARVRRLGQKREVELARIVVEGSYDMNLLEMQLRKSANIASILNSKEFAENASMAMLEFAGWTETQRKAYQNAQTSTVISIEEDDDLEDYESDDDDEEDIINDEEYVPKKQAKNQKSKKKTTTKATALFPESSDEESSGDDDDENDSDSGNGSDTGGKELDDNDMNNEQADYDDIGEEDSGKGQEDDLFAKLSGMKTEE